MVCCGRCGSPRNNQGPLGKKRAGLAKADRPKSREETPRKGYKTQT
jgi:hypothetical protein